MIITLTKIGSNPPVTKTVKVKQPEQKWKDICGNNTPDIGNFNGIGKLRADGYDVSPIKGHAVVYEVK